MNQRDKCYSSLKNSEQVTDYENLLFENVFLEEELGQEDLKFDEYFDNLINDVFREKPTTDHKKSNMNMINIPNQYPKRQSNDEKIKFNMNLNQFVEYLSIKILTDKNLNLTKNTLIYLYRHFQNEFIFMTPLKRDERRNKNKIYKKLHVYSNQIVYCFETNPIKYLKPVILYSNYQKNFHLSHIKRVNYLKKMLKMK